MKSHPCLCKTSRHVRGKPSLWREHSACEKTLVFPTRTENIRRVETKSPVFVMKMFVTLNVSRPCNENISHVKVTCFVIRIFVM